MAHDDVRLGRWHDKTVFWGFVALLWVAFCGELVREASGREYWRIYPFLMMAILGLVAIWRIILAPTIRVNADCLLVRNRFQKWCIRGCDVERITWESGEGPRIWLRNGRWVSVDAYRAWPAGGRRERVIEMIHSGCERATASETLDTTVKAAWGLAEGILVLSVVTTFTILLTAS